MKVYRITQSAYKEDISGYGAYLYGGRWNSKGFAALYAAGSISLAVLELVVNFGRSATSLQQSYHLLTIDIPDKSIEIFDAESLPKDWLKNELFSQSAGTQFLQQNKQLALKVPSAVVSEEFNFLINLAHTLFNEVKIIKAVKYSFDNRLLK